MKKQMKKQMEKQMGKQMGKKMNENLELQNEQYYKNITSKMNLLKY